LFHHCHPAATLAEAQHVSTQKAIRDLASNIGLKKEVGLSRDTMNGETSKTIIERTKMQRKSN
jgi:hypothetical protein